MIDVEAQRAALGEWLQRREPTQPAKLLETHISFLALQGDRAFKLKKAVKFPFIDLSTPERRRIDCEREVRLNRRLAPDVYLGVVPLLDADGTLVDRLVEMKRMPADASLEHLATCGADLGRCLAELAVQLARFHEDAATGGPIDAAATRDEVLRLWDRNAAELDQFAGTVLSEAALGRANALARRYLHGRERLFRDRIDAHRIRDGHGDLLAADVYCLDGGPQALDCLEFDDALRYGDCLSDVAFLAMDLERVGRAAESKLLLDAYARAAGDSWSQSLEDFYIAYRALVRAKVAAFGAALDADKASVAQQLQRLALVHLTRGRVRLVLIGGPPATGKTTVARAVADRLGWPVLHSDEIRKELAGLGSTESAAAPLDRGLYAAELRRAAYAQLLRRAREELMRGLSVIIDASWSEPAERDRAAAVSSKAAADLIAVRCDVPLETAQRRAARRAAEARDASDASGVLVDELTARFTPWPEANDLDASELESAVAAVVGLLNAEVPPSARASRPGPLVPPPGDVGL